MTEDQKTEDQKTDRNKTEETDAKSARQKMGEGIKQGIGVLSAFKDALEETIQEARDRGDLSAERAKEVMKEALGKAQTAASEARERLDFVAQADFDELEARVAALEKRVLGTPESDGGTADDESGVGADAAS